MQVHLYGFMYRKNLQLAERSVAAGHKNAEAAIFIAWLRAGKKVRQALF